MYCKPADVEILQPDQFSVPVGPSDSIYFKHFPYRITLQTDLAAHEHDNDTINMYRVTLLEHELRKIKKLNLLSGKIRSKVNSRTHSGKSILLYVQNTSDLETIVNKFTEFVKDISGPVSENHLNILQSRSVLITLKKNLWHGKYDCRVHVRLTKVRHVSSSEFDIVKQDFYKFLFSNMKIFLFRARFFSMNFFCDYAEFQELLPFLKMCYPNLNIIIEKAMLIDK